MAFHVKNLLRNRILINYCVQHAAKRPLSKCLLLSPSFTCPLQSNIFHKVNSKKGQNVEHCLDPRIYISVSQSSDSSVLKENEDVNSSEEEKESDRLFHSVRVECRGYDVAILRSYCKFITTAANHLEITLDKVEFPRYHVKRWTLLKSVHVYKKHRVQYEVRTHFLIMHFLRLTSSTADTFLEYIQRNLPEGVSMKVSKEELLPLPKYVKGSDEVAPPSS